MVKESTDRIFILVSKIRDEESIIDSFIYKDEVLYDLILDFNLELPFKRWHIKKAQPVCRIESLKTGLDELFDKSTRYSHSTALKQSCHLRELSNVAGKYFPRVFRPQLILDHQIGSGHS